MEVDKSSLIVSKAGRDKGQLFYVVDTDDQYVYLADGRLRTLTRLKKKKRKHIQIDSHIVPEIRVLLEQDQELTNEVIKRVIKNRRRGQEV